MFGSAIKVDNKRASIMSVQSNKTASTTKSALRASNATLLETLQGIADELRSHRSIMLDIQSRVTHLEPRVNELEASNPSHERAWWQATQQYVRADTDVRSPIPPETPDDTPPDTPPELMLDEPLHAAGDASPSTPNDNFSENRVEIQDESSDTACVDDTRTTEIIYDEKKISPVPRLGPAPSPRASTPKQTPNPKVDTPRVEDTDLSGHAWQKTSSTPSQAPTLRDKRSYRGVRSMATYEMRVNNSKTGKEHTVLVHFHNPKQLAHLT